MADSLHGGDNRLASDIQHEELHALLVGELLRRADGLLLAPLEAPLLVLSGQSFDEIDFFYHFFLKIFCRFKFYVYLCSVLSDYPLSMRGGYEPYRHAPKAIKRWLFFIFQQLFGTL